MKRAFIYKDEKSHKFWWIDYSGCDFAVNYGKFFREVFGKSGNLLAQKRKKDMWKIPDLTL